MRRLIPTLVILTSLAAPLHADGWSLLATATVLETEEDGIWQAEKTFPPALQAAAEDFAVKGYYVPVEAQAWIQTFLLVADPANCPFCGGGGSGPVLEVEMKRPLPDMAEFTVIAVRGRLEFIDDPDTLQMFRLKDAILVE